ncbi:hypothetical protein IQ241_04965 [Romeria aff. gracilis LEGE 07310]|uniref:Uncharacterized protein n=1 Tax=Vasconcelosia minhoensis LEGE 07310 TaxID=915328 RepID=A0A8J7AU37_9CYAN|nr:hypothetical protein [Romeria gracilis]MBE9076653.1 hypothetical protein [Romeria aff. gracilis LEGE 07310]
MSSAASRPHNSPEPSSENSNRQAADLSQPPVRPTLMSPPSRPAPPPEPAQVQPAAADEALSAQPDTSPQFPDQPLESQPRQSPISPPSEPMQYRAIGLLRGRYIPSEEQFNRGDILTQDESTIDAVLLGRVTSLIKKHIDLDSDHLWVVYPRTFQREEDTPALHVQIVGVWEPETLSTNENQDEATVSATADGSAQEQAKLPAETQVAAPAAEAPTTSENEQANYFSIRGEITKYVEDKEEITVNIVQKAKKDNKPKRPFRLTVSGRLEGKTIGYFWDLKVERQGRELVLQEGKSIAVVPPKKKPKSQGGGRQRFSRSDRKPPDRSRSGRSETPKPTPKPALKSQAQAQGQSRGQSEPPEESAD